MCYMSIKCEKMDSRCNQHMFVDHNFHLILFFPLEVPVKASARKGFNLDDPELLEACAKYPIPM